jgi:hypothetical protein
MDCRQRVLASATAAASLPPLNWMTSSEKLDGFGRIRTSSHHQGEFWEMPFPILTPGTGFL